MAFRENLFCRANLKANLLGHCRLCPGLVLTDVHGNRSIALSFLEGFCSLLPQEMNILLHSLEVLKYGMRILNFLVCNCGHLDCSV